jgi:hypothetical protein
MNSKSIQFRPNLFSIGLVCLSFFWHTTLPAAILLHHERVYLADTHPTHKYIHSGLITGGDQSVDNVTFKTIRCNMQPDFDQVIIDLSGSREGEDDLIQQPPYYQVAIDQSRIMLSFWGTARLDFSPTLALASCKRSSVIQGIQFFPQIEPGLWTFVINLKTHFPIEVFEHSNPVQVFLDIQHPNSLKKRKRKIL